jgi:hypothetical protein
MTAANNTPNHAFFSIDLQTVLNARWTEFMDLLRLLVLIAMKYMLYCYFFYITR